MDLIIRVKDGQPFEHPIFLDNFVQAFPDVDVNNLPAEFAKFIRNPVPKMGPYEVYAGVVYERADDGSFFDAHKIRPMTSEEKAARQQAVKDAWVGMPFVSWSFNEETCQFEAPVPMPTDGKMYAWDEQNQEWNEVTA